MSTLVTGKFTGGYDLHCNCLCQKAFILAQALSESSDFLICGQYKS